ncbi:TPA: pyridoxal phosphate-dependent aminotransferase [Clostridioides difficile]|uniref:pyridoxal phosphate-dependent aminotransferase n=1 Tax=Clostridioides difficile TaxID=1496 RepID=UPI001C16884A|nr:pyridoxal phosphate-dependent aminotransferase [Clostridioides difficile]HBF4254021.1 pyridoxal phosphate-dependent aminotransferase [Clostridioides difficile]
MYNHMKKVFQGLEGGLFSSVEKADVGDSYQKLGEQGVSLMGWADPFFPDYCIPRHILDAAILAISSNMSTHYTAPVGNDLLKIEIAKKLKEVNKLDVDFKRNILITPGSDSGLYYSMLPFINEGDEVLIPTPCYPNNIQNTKLMGGVPIFVELKESDGYQIDITEFEKRLTNKTKLVVLTHPNNPTTTVFNKESLEKLAKFIIDNDLILICDQAFEDFTFENELMTPASLEGMFERTVTIFSTSKGMGLSGFRVAYMVCSDKLMDKYYGAAVTVLGATNTVAQMATIEAFKDRSFMGDFERVFDKRRQEAYKIINEIPNVSMQMPESGFLGWINVSKLGTSSEIQKYLVDEAKVCINDGINYGPGGEGHLRIILGSYKDDSKVISALNRIKDALIKKQQ